MPSDHNLKKIQAVFKARSRQLNDGVADFLLYKASRSSVLGKSAIFVHSFQNL
jgi:hypothetical protein